jgi:SAM-dependent methyltransferase
LRREVASQSRERHAEERHLTRILDEVRTRLTEPLPQDHLQTIGRIEKRACDTFSAAFGEQFRGTRADVKARLRVYLEPVKETIIGQGEGPMIDLGCGRGEWLELLQEEGIRATGVERNPLLVETCRQQKLDVVENDILSYLCALPDNSVGGVTGFHIIEHLSFEALLELFDEIVRVLRRGGIAIFETPNPQNVLVSTQEFYLDPGHQKPLPSALLQFVAEAKGLHRVKLLHLHPFPEASKVEEAGLEMAKRFNELFYGPRDYALVGWKA